MAPNHLIQEKLQQIPELPGIYKMLDARGNIIYIGKSKCLKKRGYVGNDTVDLLN